MPKRGCKDGSVGRLGNDVSRPAQGRARLRRAAPSVASPEDAASVVCWDRTRDFARQHLLRLLSGLVTAMGAGSAVCTADLCPVRAIPLTSTATVSSESLAA
jgi:hypothetical protein